MRLDDPAHVRAQLGLHFTRVERRDADGTVAFATADAIRRYLGSSERLAGYAERVPELSEPLAARRRPVVFVADK